MRHAALIADVLERIGFEVWPKGRRGARRSTTSPSSRCTPSGELS
ncbi:hypothetical protein [Neomegalonema perideroedes]|nr:hypothetical protein [Neomegalonema perideroedes]